MIKPRILWASEASYLSTGYAVYSREILTRLHKSGLFDIIEFGSYGSNEDSRCQNIPWKFIGNLPQRNNKFEEDAYNSNPINQFGSFKFDHVVNLIKPHIVYSNTDVWMMTHCIESPFRPYFHYTWLSAVDGLSQPPGTKDILTRCNSVTSYTDWGVDLINKETNNQANSFKSCPGGAPPEMIPMNKLELKKSFGLENKKIITFVARNQRRKLFSDLLESFRLFLDKTKKTDVLLYLHTGWPDKNPWKIPEIINQYNLSSKVIMTYRCNDTAPNNGCGYVAPRFFSDYGVICPNCRQMMTTANVQNGVDSSFLSKIYNLSDLFVQYANSESLGIPTLEAAACNVPVMAIDYSAMSDTVRKLNGVPIKVKALYRELETHVYRAVPDNNDFVDKLIDFFNKPESLRNRDGILAGQGYKEHYGYDKTTQNYINHWSSLNFEELESRWKLPSRIFPIAEQIDHSNVNTGDYCKFLICNVWGEPSKLGSYTHSRLLNDLNHGCSVGLGGQFELNEMSILDMGAARPFSRQDAYNQFKNLGEKRNYWEKMRTNG